MGGGAYRTTGAAVLLPTGSSDSSTEVSRSALRLVMEYTQRKEVWRGVLG